MDSIAERLKIALDARGLKQADLVRLTGIGKSSISTYLTGDYEPKQRNIYKMAKALNVSEAWLLGEDVPMERGSLDDPMTIPSLAPLPNTVKKPRLGTTACGTPILAEQNIEEYDEVPDNVHCDFTLICRGDSMIGARILDGDTVYVRQQADVENGQIAVVLIDNETTLKRVYKYPDKLVLQPENPLYAPIVYVGDEMAQIRILGLAVAFTSKVK